MSLNEYKDFFRPFYNKLYAIINADKLSSVEKLLIGDFLVDITKLEFNEMALKERLNETTELQIQFFKRHDLDHEFYNLKNYLDRKFS